MADVAEEVIPGPLRDWLAAHRTTLNGRFRQAQRRFPRLDAQAVLALCGEILPPLIEGSAPTDLLSVVYDLILLHAGRSLLTPGASESATASGLEVLLRQTFPRLLPHLRARPRHLPGALSNAVERLGPEGATLARLLAEQAPLLRDPQQILDLGVLTAWRLGEARLREPALALAKTLPAALVRSALGFPELSEEETRQAVEGLQTDGWQHPLRKAAKGWTLTGTLGNFQGFGGKFLEPPLLLDPGEGGSRHRFWVRSGEEIYRLDADLFGCVCLRDQVELPPSQPSRRSLRLPLLAEASSFWNQEDLIVFTRPDSFRIRVLRRL